MSNYTKGPWQVQIGVNAPGSIEVYSESSAICEIWRRRNPKAELAAAYLIAAAPDLLEALESLYAVVGLTAFKHESQRAVLQEAMDIASMAIAKAKGEV